MAKMSAARKKKLKAGLAKVCREQKKASRKLKKMAGLCAWALGKKKSKGKRKGKK